MHPLIKINKNNKLIPYLHTSVSFDKSVSEIKEMLVKYGCERIIVEDKVVHIQNKKYLAHVIGFEQKGIRYIINAPLTIVIQGKNNQEIENDKVSGRIVLNKVKALLVDVEIGYLTFSQAMIPFMALPTPNGEIISVSDYIELNKNQIQSGIGNFFMLGSGDKNG